MEFSKQPSSRLEATVCGKQNNQKGIPYLGCLGWFEIKLGFLLWFGVVPAVMNERKRERGKIQLMACEDDQKATKERGCQHDLLKENNLTWSPVVFAEEYVWL